MSLMGNLYLGTSGITTSQNALNTTAHNLSNVDTAGYTRQQVVQADSIYNVLNSTMAIGKTSVGLGVTLAEVRQVRDRFMDSSYRMESGRQAFYEASYQSISEMESFFGELEGVQAQTAITELWSSIEEVMKQPNDTTQLAMLKQKAAAFVERSNDIAAGLADYQASVDIEVQNTVLRINQLGQQIVDLNKQICGIEGGGIENANDLRDLRNSALDELGSLIKIDYKEDADNMVLVRAENVDFVTKSGIWKMGTKFDEKNAMTIPVWDHLNGTDVYDFSTGISTLSNTDIGQLKAYVLARGLKRADYTDVPIEPNAEDYAGGEADPEYQTALKTFNDKMYGIAKPKESDYAGGSGSQEYQDAMKQYENQLPYDTVISNSVINKIQAEYDQLFHSIVTTINDILSPNTEVTLADGSKVKVLDKDKCSFGANGEQGIELFSRNGYDRYTVKQLTLDDGSTGDYYVYNEENEGRRGTMYTVGNVVMNPTVMQNVNTIGMTTKQGDADYERAADLVDAWGQRFAKLNPYSNAKVDYQSYYIQLIGEIGNLGSVYKSISDALSSTSEYLDNKRNEVAGVSSDEELTNMVKFQNAYNASSRYINVVNEMLEHLISQLGTR